ncbi:MAG: DUF1036 domain-containing protein [Bacteroidales bacterium]|nr:DUF1036 domain-containing protein [Candidatus Colimorpha pelethequi]
MKKKLCFTLCLVICIVANAFPSVYYVFNNTDSPIEIAVMYRVSKNGFNGWVSDGWYKALPNEKVCVATSSKMSKSNTGIYVFARSSDGKREYYGYDGSGKQAATVYVIDKAFTIKNCDMDYVKSQYKNAYTVKMKFYPNKTIGLLQHRAPEQTIIIEASEVSREKTMDGKKWYYYVDLNTELPSQFLWTNTDNNYTEPVPGCLEWLKKNGYKQHGNWGRWYKIVK